MHIAATIDAFDEPDIVVDNAGFTHQSQPPLPVHEATFGRIFAVNVKTIDHMVHAVVEKMRAHGGDAMLNVGSTVGIRP